MTIGIARLIQLQINAYFFDLPASIVAFHAYKSPDEQPKYEDQPKTDYEKVAKDFAEMSRLAVDNL